MDSPLTAPVAPFKIEENPFSPSTYPVDEEMYPSLPSPQDPAPPAAAPPLPHGHILVGGVYYQPVPAPHNVVVAQSAVPPPSLVPVAPTEAPALSTPNDSDAESIVVVKSAEIPESRAGTQSGSSVSSTTTKKPEPKVGLEFAMPKTPPPANRPAKKAKNGRRSWQRSRSSSSNRSSSQRDEIRASIPRGVNTSDVPAPTLKGARGRGRGKIVETNAPLLIPTTPYPFNGVIKPKERLKVTVSAGDNAKKDEATTAFPPVIQHLSNLDTLASARWELAEATSVQSGFTVEVPQEALPEDSDIDIRTGKVKDPSPWSKPLTFTYKDRSVLEDHQRFAAEVLRQEPKLWDRHQVENTPSLFYQEYFLDQQKLSDVRSKGQTKIQHFNVKVTRQEPSENANASSKANKGQLEAKFKLALSSLYEAFEEAFTNSNILNS